MGEFANTLSLQVGAVLLRSWNMRRGSGNSYIPDFHFVLSPDVDILNMILWIVCQFIFFFSFLLSTMIFCREFVIHNNLWFSALRGLSGMNLFTLAVICAVKRLYISWTLTVLSKWFQFTDGNYLLMSIRFALLQLSIKSEFSLALVSIFKTHLNVVVAACKWLAQPHRHLWGDCQSWRLSQEYCFLVSAW